LKSTTLTTRRRMPLSPYRTKQADKMKYIYICICNVIKERYNKIRGTDDRIRWDNVIQWDDGLNNQYYISKVYLHSLAELSCRSVKLNALFAQLTVSLQ
jgi:hypothetical protein